MKTRQGWLHLTLAMDIWSSWPTRHRRWPLTSRNNPKGYMHHGDHGSQYVLLLLSKTMSKHDIRPSMGSISSPWDNAAMESLMDLVKSEEVHARSMPRVTRRRWICSSTSKVIYNGARIHTVLDDLSPVEFEEAN